MTFASIPAPGGIFTAPAYNLPTNSDKPTFYASFSLAPTAAMDLVAIESGASKIVRLRALVLLNPGNQTSAGLRTLTCMRTTTAGTGSAIAYATGGALGQANDGDTAFSGIVRSGNTGGNLGTAGKNIWQMPVFVPGALAAFQPVVFDLDGGPWKVPTGIAGVTNGISIRDAGAAGGANMTGFVVFTEESA